MILGLLKQYKKFAAVVGVLLLIMAVMAWQLRGEIRENSRLQSNIKQLEQAHQANLDAMEELEQEMQHREKVIQDYQEDLARIQEEARREKQDLKNRLSALRSDYEDIDDFLSLPVPERFADEWMRQRAAGGDRDPDQED